MKDKIYMGMHSLITTGNLVNKEFSFYEVPYKLDIFDDETYKKSNNAITKIKYSKYPNLVHAINNRYKNNNNSVERIIDMKNKKELFVIRPSKHINIKRVEKDETKLQEMYDLGVSDCMDKLKELKDYLLA